MLKLLDKYILKRYLGSFFFIIFLFSMLSVVIDFAHKIEDFVEDGPTSKEIIVDYYLNFIPYINSLLFPLYALIAVIFFTSRLASNSEIIAMIGNGVNYYRLLVPYLVGALIISGIHYLGNHYWFPMSSAVRVQFENKYIWKHNYEGSTKDIHFFIGENEEAYFHTFSRHDTSGRNFLLMRYDSTGIERPFTINAQKIEFIKQPNHWRLKNFRVRTINGLKENLRQGKSLDTTLNIKPSDLMRRDNLKQTMTTPELTSYIARERERGARISVPFEVELYRRTADPFSILVLTIIGFSVASRKTRGGMGWHLVIGIGLSALYIFMSKFSTTFSTNGGLPPIIGVWIPNIVFSLVAIWMLFKAQK